MHLTVEGNNRSRIQELNETEKGAKLESVEVGFGRNNNVIKKEILSFCGHLAHNEDTQLRKT